MEKQDGGQERAVTKSPADQIDAAALRIELLPRVETIPFSWTVREDDHKDSRIGTERKRA